VTLSVTVFVDKCCVSLQKTASDRPKYEALLDHRFVKHLSTTPIDISTFVCDILDTPSPADDHVKSENAAISSAMCF